MLDAEFAAHQGQGVVDVARAVGDGRGGEEEELDGHVVVGRLLGEAGEGPVDAGDVDGAVLLCGPNIESGGVGVAVEAIQAVAIAIGSVSIAVSVAVDVGFRRVLDRVVLLRGEKVAPEGVCSSRLDRYAPGLRIMEGPPETMFLCRNETNQHTIAKQAGLGGRSAYAATGAWWISYTALGLFFFLPGGKDELGHDGQRAATRRDQA